MKTKGLKFKIATAILLASVTVALFAATVLFPFEKGRREARLERIETLLTAVYEQNKEELANEVFANQMLALQNTLQSIQQVKNITHLAAYHLDGSLLATTGGPYKIDMVGTQLAPLRLAPRFVKVQHDGKSFAQWGTAIEIIGERLGYFFMLYDLSEMEHDFLMASLFFFALLMSALFFMGIFLHLLLARSVTAPAALLRDAIRNVSQGQLGHKVVLDSRDEIGDIARDFNTMSLKLQDQHMALSEAVAAKESYAQKLVVSNRQLADLNTNLEKMVEARTEELKRSYAQLEQEVTERKRADKEKKQLEERLLRSQKMEALGLLAGGVAHDLNNVLSGIVSYPELLLLQIEPDSPLHKPIKTIQKSGQKAAAIVQDLLTLARRGVMNHEVLDLNRQVVKPYLISPEHAQLMTTYPGITLHLHLAKNLFLIEGSAIHLTKTVMNLVTNAAESIDGAGEITIKTENRYADLSIKGYDTVGEGEYVVMTVEDTGLGIAPDDLNRIFEPFYTRKKLGRSGTGLGMAVVWGTVQDHNGHINVDSREGYGTTFELFFPVTRADRPASPEGPSLESLTGNGEKILVVDDVESQREITSSILQELGYDVATVSSGEDALVYLKEKPVDLVILDMIMDPGIDGLDTYRLMQQDHPGQKVVIASGFAENERVREAQALGAGPYIRKPFTLQNIGQAVKKTLSP